MKLTSPFSVIKNAISDIKRVPKESFWEQECRKHPTNQHCLVYCN